jgi:hypothetical protein
MSSAIGFLLCNFARFSKKLLILLFSIFALLLSLNGFAANGVDNLGRIDYDLDDNGLIEINDLADLDEIRNNLDGKTLYGSNVGCPNAEDGTVNGGCTGFELTADLDFDTNQNGQIDAGDEYRNITPEGIAEGWLPIGGSSGGYFSAHFNGNGYVIKNLNIYRRTRDYVGLFGYVKDARIENLVIAGLHSLIVGDDSVGALVGDVVSNTQIRNIYIAANVKGYNYVGGLAGEIHHGTHIENVFASGSASGRGNVGGLIGFSWGTSGKPRSSIGQSLSVVIVSANDSAGGLVAAVGQTDIANSYWAKDTSTQAYSAGRSEDNSYVGLSHSALQCATAKNTDADTGCVSYDGSEEGLNSTVILYRDWDSSVWDFGTSPNAGQQLPGLKFNGQVVRDSDGDGSLDQDDVWPNNSAASQDFDQDGYPDAWSWGCDDACIQGSGLTLDQFPNHAWATVDADFDGLPDGAENCVSECQRDGLIIDASLGDYDNDGILDALDFDENNDGIDDADADHDGLVDIDSLEKLNAMRFQLQGIGLALGTINSSGCPFIIYQGIYQQRCSGYELTQDLNFDTNSDGVIDSNDDYWNENSGGIGEGWKPVGGSEYDYFSGHFNGNGHVIKNLTINRPNSLNIGLFGYIKNARIENLAIGGFHSLISGRDSVGALVGEAASNIQIRNVYIAAAVRGEKSVAGIIGKMGSGSHIENSFVSGSVNGDSSVGGIVGYSNGSYYNANSSIANSLSVSSVSSETVKGLVGSLYSTDIINSYWAEGQNYTGLKLSTLKCAIAENTDFNTGCVSVDGSDEGLNAPVVLYKDWDPLVWDFGIAPNASEQLPGLKFNGQVLRDGDGDGILDEDDVWPNDRSASLDFDKDGYPDSWSLSCDDACIQASSLILDHFPLHDWAALDADFDGLPDGFENCVSNCELDGLTKDGALGDYDNDGILDSEDDDEFGVAKVDVDGDGLIDIDSLDKLNAMRFQLQGAGLQLTDISTVDVTGCPFIIHQGTYQQRCSGYELTKNLDFDTNGDGKIDIGDAYWNANVEGVGEGWLPVGNRNDGYFSSHFNGNGYAIKNLTINRPTVNGVGLFGAIKHAKIENLTIGGLHSIVIGRSAVGGLVGMAEENSQIRNVVIAANIQGKDDVGGLIGWLRLSSVENCFASGLLSSDGSDGSVGGIVGESYGGNSIRQVLTTSVVSETGNTVRPIGYEYNTDVINSYWAKDRLTQAHYNSEADSYVALEISTLQCATAENTDFSTGCVSADGSSEGLSYAVTLYKNWDPAVWDFGIAPNANQQLPGLKFNDQVSRDGDGDGVLDDDDTWPINPAASLDSDGDGYPDAWSRGCDDSCILASGLTLDQFPHHAWAAVDADFDGLPDGVENCVSDCQLEGLTKDGALGDYDNDGILDAEDSDEYGVPKVDMDGDSLIEIDSLEKLNAMRFQLQGAGLQLTDISAVDVTGCPFIIHQGTYQQRCSGYELTNNLDFDTSGDGRVDSDDAYWNPNYQGIGEGWEPVGGNGLSFGAHFNGNGYVIENLTINRPRTDNVGLFRSIRDGTIENLVIAGANSSIVGDENVGALTGSASYNSLIRNVVIVANVQGSDSVAGLAGSIYRATQIENVFVSGSVSGENHVAGLVGRSTESNSNIKNSISQSLSVSVITGLSDESTGGLVGYLNDTAVTNSYWAKDTSTQLKSYDNSEVNGYVGLNLAKLQCAIAENTDSSSGCVSVDGSDEHLNRAVVIYGGWDPAVWDFGIAPNANQQLPGLKFNGQVYRDSDGDGSLDRDDSWPNNRAASQDFDGDGSPDAWSGDCDDACILSSGLILDQFPNHAWAALDADFDGMPDGAESCVSDCQLDGLIKDGALGDFDNDGILDAVDTDENNDDIDDIDADHNGLIDISNLDKLNAMRFQLQGVGLQSSYDSSVDISGCPFIIFQGTYQQRCSGYELTQDLDFDTNADGQINRDDDYWNQNSQGVGEGWEPVGYGRFGNSYPFNAQFNGNGHVIKNLTINRPEENNVGLFGYTQGAQIENLVISHGSVIGDNSVGALVGLAHSSRISDVVIVANVQGNYSVGGLVGLMNAATKIENVFTSGSVSGDRKIGGLVGSSYEVYSNPKNLISQSLNVSVISANSDVGGLVGTTKSTDIINSYWATNVSTQFESLGSSEANSYVGLSLAKLQCAIVENTDSTTGCVSEDGFGEGLNAAMVLYKDWDPAIWDFGTDPSANQQLPGLKLNGRVFRDSDGDGLLDVDDSSPFDHDNDGILDVNDDYPLIAGDVYVDSDNDGMPDHCNQSCLDLGMIEDADDDNDEILDVDDRYPLIAIGELADLDADGIPNNCDQACLDLGMLADTDDDNDGSIDTDDFYPLIAVGSLDTDHDGIPNDCDQTCLDVGMVADIDDDNDNVLDDADFYPLIASAGLVDTDQDGIPNDCDQACLDLGMIADADDDNDGSIDTVDEYPLIAVGSLDTDHDGIPNDCDQACLDLGMVADTDNDNDGVIDTDDFYPLIAVDSLDTDRDGIPNDCDQACLDSDMVADIDDDNDGVLDAADFYPLISLSGALDSDGDGIPDECNQPCLDSGMVADTVYSIDSDNDGVFDEVDAFASNPAAAIDDDNDGKPDVWNDNCLAQCQADSGLVKDPSLNDTDNDGATNDVDSDFENDNGKPTLLTVPETMYAAVNTADGSGFIVDSLTVDSLLSQLTAVDFVDEPSALTAKAYLNNVELVRNENGEITLPSGLLALNWVAVDSSGNESEPLEQLVYVYPQVRFKSAASITGEASQAEIIVELTGDSPVYPISIDLLVNSDLSSIDQADLNVSFDLAAIHTVVIEAGDDAELLNREASLIIPIVEDGESENDELLVMEFQPVLGNQDYHEFIVVAEGQKAHELTVTYQNLAPTVQLLILQDEQSVTSIAMDGGAVTLLAIVSDGNGLDEHTYHWDLDGLIVEDISVSTLTFEPSDFAAREYLVSVTVTDNGSNPLSVMANQKLILLAVEEPPITEPPVTEPPANPSSVAEASSGGSSGGGAMAWILLLLMTLAVVGQHRRYAKVEKE